MRNGSSEHGGVATTRSGVCSVKVVAATEALGFPASNLRAQLSPRSLIRAQQGGCGLSTRDNPPLPSSIILFNHRFCHFTESFPHVLVVLPGNAGGFFFFLIMPLADGGVFWMRRPYLSELGFYSALQCVVACVACCSQEVCNDITLT